MTQIKRIELTDFEKMLTYPQQFGDYLVMGTLFIESSTAVDANLVRKAVVLMQERHPFYRAYLEVANLKENRMYLNMLNYDDDPNLANKIKLEWLDLTNENSDYTSLRKRLIEESARFDTQIFEYGKDNLLWKLQVIAYKQNESYKYVFNLVNHIAITDGFNTNTLTVEIVNILNALMTHRECAEMREKLLPIENLNVLCKERGIFKEEIHQAKIEEMDKREMPKFRLHEKFKSNNESGFYLDFFKLDKEMTSQILTRSKSHGVRLTGYFQTVALYALKRLYDKENLTFPTSNVIIEIAASLRVRYKPMLEFYNGGFHTTMVIFEADKKRFGKFVDFWSDARYVHELVEENTSIETGSLFSLSHSKRLDEYNRVFYESNSLEEVCQILNKEVECDLGVSNLGRYVNDYVSVFSPDDSPIKIREMYCTDPLNSNPSITPAIVLHVLYWKGEIFIELGANKSSIGSSYVDMYKNFLMETIESSLK